MYRSRRIGALSTATVLALTLVGCATLRVNSYLERGVEFDRYRTYAWGPLEPFSTGDPRLDNNRFFGQRVEEAVDMQLAARGFEKASAGAADLLIHIHARVDQRLEASDYDRAFRHCTVGDCRQQVYDAGTLLLDFVDRRTNTLAWRGWAERSLDGVIDDQAWLESTIDHTVARILSRLPLKAS
jgi:hypothetical protein